ncbi:MAG: 2OG-Fe(II) oxygenase [Timaviella obliquedivisa GSE-PSE-MK23-08B]|jgi:peroxiredoxin|nr:2OG-Fe(II) oxygenase [Timaviella obliquedivisa GSE-PSE-MK23-08B]
MFLSTGEPAPWFTAASTTNPKYYFGSVAGRYVLLCFLKSSTDAASQKVLEGLAHHREIFDDEFCCFFGVSIDPDDEQSSRLQEHIPGIRFFWDFDQSISQQFGVVQQNNTYHSCTYVLDERLRVLTVLPFATQPENHFTQLISILEKLPEIPPPGMASVQAPVLVVPRIFEPELCQMLIDYYHHQGGEESGFMKEEKGRTVLISDHNFKRRRDQEILDKDLRNAAMFRIHDRLVPEIQKAFQFQATRIERHIVACYDGASGGFFRPHQDNTTKGTAHRRFAVSLNLNTGEYEGGLLRFPEFGRQTYTAPAGGAVVFSCSLLHEATPVTEGWRYAYLPFLYDDAAAKIREINQDFIGEKSQSKGFQSKPTKARKKRR